jgi:hypothetical protein
MGVNGVEVVSMEENAPKLDSIGRKIYSIEERERLMAECEASGKTRKAFAQEQSLNYPTLIYWFTHCNKRKESTLRQSDGVQLKPIDTRLLFHKTIRKDAIMEIVIWKMVVGVYWNRKG